MRCQPRSEQSEQNSQKGTRGPRLQVNAAGLASDRRELNWIADGLDALVHVALTARCELHSGAFPSLKKAQRRRPERKNKQDSPSTRDIGVDEHCGCNEAGAEEHHTEGEPLAALVGTDVGGDAGHQARSRSGIILPA